MREIEIVPSVLPADFANLGRDITALHEAGIDRIQWDVMDGQYVPNITVGADVIKACRDYTDVPFEAHMMVYDAERFIDDLADAGCQMVIYHPDTLKHPHRVFQQTRDAGMQAAIGLSPTTSNDVVDFVCDLIDMVLVMTVNPGFGGQAYIETMEAKVAEMRARLDRLGYPEMDLEVDGGIGPTTIAGAARAGANVFISGSALWKYPSFAEGVADLRARAQAARADQ